MNLSQISTFIKKTLQVDVWTSAGGYAVADNDYIWNGSRLEPRWINMLQLYDNSNYTANQYQSRINNPTNKNIVIFDVSIVSPNQGSFGICSSLTTDIIQVCEVGPGVSFNKHWPKGFLVGTQTSLGLLNLEAVGINDVHVTMQYKLG